MTCFSLFLQRALLPVFAAALFASLTACGGGGDGGNAGTPPGGSGGNGGSGNGPGGGAVGNTIGFSSQPSTTNTTAALALLNQQGASGNAYVGPHTFIVSTNPLQYTFDEIFVKAQPGTTYQYKSVAAPDNGSAVLAMLNAEGDKGYLYKGNTTFGGEPASSLFVKSSSRITTYSWRLVEGAFALATLNSNGAQGYAYRGDYAIIQEGKLYGLYVKDNSSAATFSYMAMPAIGNASGLLAEMNSMGAQNFVYMGSQTLGTSSVSVYEKNSASTQATVFSSAASTLNQTTTELITKANQQGAQGNMYISDLEFGSGPSATATSFFYKGSASINPFYGPVLP
jgi:hypothetical protein